MHHPLGFILANLAKIVNLVPRGGRSGRTNREAYGYFYHSIRGFIGMKMESLASKARDWMTRIRNAADSRFSTQLGQYVQKREDAKIF
jgi:hypothetical protein